ncbi:hypothetical protein ACSBPQ_15015 [Stenotrophomonas sp. JC08]|uniref:hypothetical protein n=1 Tax=Stenotrophomonas sp. JC08 TaxID=3445779 RepID=UPI003FA2BD7F
MKIPADIHQRVVELTDAILAAGQSGDAGLAGSRYQALLAYCQATAAAGRDHPFLWETLADFTGDDHLAIGHYRHALALALAGADAAADYAASICLALAERHTNLDESSTAHAYALQAEEHARGSDDLPLHQAIHQFLLEHPSAAGPH